MSFNIAALEAKIEALVEEGNKCVQEINANEERGTALKNHKEQIIGRIQALNELIQDLKTDEVTKADVIELKDRSLKAVATDPEETE